MEFGDLRSVVANEGDDEAGETGGWENDGDNLTLNPLDLDGIRKTF